MYRWLGGAGGYINGYISWSLEKCGCRGVSHGDHRFDLYRVTSTHSPTDSHPPYLPDTDFDHPSMEVHTPT